MKDMKWEIYKHQMMNHYYRKYIIDVLKNKDIVKIHNIKY